MHKKADTILNRVGYVLYFFYSNCNIFNDIYLHCKLAAKRELPCSK